MKYFILALLLFLYPQKAHAYQEEYQGLLSTHIKEVKEPFRYNGIDYDAWAQDVRHKKARLKIQKTKIDNFKKDEEKAAFLMNAYNFFLIDLIIQKGERDSIRDLDGVKKTEIRYNWSIGSDVYTLQDIENRIWDLIENPKIYFGLTCAAKSCPDIRKEPYTAKKLNVQLNEQMKFFLQNEGKGLQNIPNINGVKISSLFEDKNQRFNNGNIRPWLQPFFPLLINARTEVRYLEFDWSLNAQN